MLLSIDSVSASFIRGETRVPVLRDVSFEVAPGELFAIYGMRASGKTTLLEIAAGLLAPDTGSVAFRGHDLAGLSRRRLADVQREGIGWVERSGPQTADVPIYVHLAVALYRSLDRHAAHERALAMLDRLGAREYAGASWDDLPDTVRTFVAIGQALIREPQILVADDPIYGLGTTERESVLALLREIVDEEGIAVLLAVPEMPAMLHADQVRILANGKLIGPPTSDTATVVRFPRSRPA